MPRKPKSLPAEAPLAPIPAAILDQFVRDGPMTAAEPAMAKTYRPYVPEQDLVLPPSLRDWLPEDHLASFVSDLIDQLHSASWPRAINRTFGRSPSFARRTWPR